MQKPNCKYVDDEERFLEQVGLAQNELCKIGEIASAREVYERLIIKREAETFHEATMILSEYVRLV